MRRVLAVLALAVALGGCGEDERVLQPGDYAGSTAGDQAVTLVVSGQPKWNGLKAEWGPKEGQLTVVGAPGKPKPVISCVMQADGTEVRCRVPEGGEVETVELMKE